MVGPRIDPHAPPSQYHVGDWVRFKWGVTPVVGIIIEDRGHIGVAGRRLWRIRVRLDDYDVRTVTLPEEEMEPSGPPPRNRRPDLPDTAADPETP